jgi:hypothetical protein
MLAARNRPASLLWVSWLGIATRAGVTLGALFVAFGARAAATSAAVPDQCPES